MTTPLMINKFKNSDPPRSIHKDLECLGFEPVLYEERARNYGVRKSVVQFYKHCQWFMSELDQEVVQCFRNPTPGYSKSEVVDEHLILFLRHQGPRFFSRASKTRKSYPDLTLYAEEASDESLLKDFHSLGQILHYLAYLLNKRGLERNKSHAQQETESSKPTLTEDLDSIGADSHLAVHETGSRASCSESSECGSPDISRDSDYDPDWVEGQESEGETTSELAAIESSLELSRTDLRKATLEYQELPPRTHKKRKRDHLVLKLNPALLREIIDRPSTMLSQDNIRVGDSAPVAVEPRCDSSSTKPKSKKSDPAPGLPTPNAGLLCPPPAVDWRAKLFKALHQSELDKTYDPRIDMGYQLKYTSDWYQENGYKPLRFENHGEFNEPDWNELAQAFGLWNNASLCEKIQKSVKACYNRYEGFLRLQPKHEERKLNMSKAVKVLDEQCGKAIASVRKDCDTKYRRHLWHLLMIMSAYSNERTDEPTPARTDEPTPARTDEPTPARTDESTPARTDESTPSKTDELTPARTDEPTPAKTDALLAKAKSTKQPGLWSGFESLHARAPVTKICTPATIQQSRERRDSIEPSTFHEVNHESAKQLHHSNIASPTFRSTPKLSSKELPQKRQRESPSTLPRQSDLILDRLKKSSEDQAPVKQQYGEDDSATAFTVTNLLSKSHSMRPKNRRQSPLSIELSDGDDPSPTSTAATTPSDVMSPTLPGGGGGGGTPNIGQKRQQDQVNLKLDKPETPKKRKTNEDSFEHSKLTLNKRAIEIKEQHGPVHFKLKVDPDGAPLHTTTSMRKSDFQDTFKLLQHKYNERIIKMKVSVPMSVEGFALDIDLESVEIGPKPPYPKLKTFLGQPALRARPEDERIFFVEPVGVKNYLDDFSDDDTTSERD